MKKRIARIEWIGPILYATAIGCAFFDTRISILLMIITPLVYFVPAREKKVSSVRYEKGVIKKYTNDEIEVTWKPELCVHAGNCFTGLPEVFNPKTRPWIKIDAAKSEEIIQQVKLCPSEALSFVKLDKKT